MSSQEVKKALDHALTFATVGAGTSFSMKAFIPLPIPVVDALPQTVIVKMMSDQLASVYGLRSLRGLTIFTAKIVGATGGVKLASEVAGLIPLPMAGPGTSAVTSFTLQLSVGIVLIIIFELLRENSIQENYIGSITFDDMGVLLGLATEVIAEIIQIGDGVEAINTAVGKFKAQNVPVYQ